jgi:hypothetical protein
VSFNSLKGFYDIADTVDRVILLFISQSNSRYRIFPIDVNTENFSPGSYRFINLSQEPVAIQLGETVAEVAPQTDKTLMPEIGSSERFTAKIAYNDGDKWDLFFASEWTHRSNRRVLVMFFKDDDGKMQTRVTPL